MEIKIIIRGQGVLYCKSSEAINPQGAILIKIGTKYGFKFIHDASKNYIRTDRKSETIVSDAIDASFLQIKF